MANNNTFYFLSSIIVMLMIATVLFQNEGKFVILFILSILLWKLYMEIYDDKLPSTPSS